MLCQKLILAKNNPQKFKLRKNKYPEPDKNLMREICQIRYL